MSWECKIKTPLSCSVRMRKKSSSNGIRSPQTHADDNINKGSLLANHSFFNPSKENPSLIKFLTNKHSCCRSDYSFVYTKNYSLQYRLEWLTRDCVLLFCLNIRFVHIHIYLYLLLFLCLTLSRGSPDISFLFTFPFLLK